MRIYAYDTEINTFYKLLMVIFYNYIILFYSNNYIILYEKHSPPRRPKLIYCRLEVNTVVAAEPATQPERRVRMRLVFVSSVFEVRLNPPRFIRTKRVVVLGWFQVWWGICVVLSDKERRQGHFTSRMASIVSSYVILLWYSKLLVDDYVINSWLCQVSHGVEAGRSTSMLP